MDIDKIVNILNNGGLVILKTDTTYGIMGDVTNLTAIENVFKAKERAKNKPLVVLVSNIEMLKKCVVSVSKKEKELIDEFWPGPLSILFNKSKYIPNEATGNLDTVAIRLPDDNELIEIMNKLGRPLFSTSANISGQDVITNVNNIDKNLFNYIDYIYDSGEIKSVPSTIIQVIDDKIKVLREGKIASKLKE